MLPKSLTMTFSWQALTINIIGKIMIIYVPKTKMTAGQIDIFDYIHYVGYMWVENVHFQFNFSILLKFKQLVLVSVRGPFVQTLCIEKDSYMDAI